MYYTRRCPKLVELFIIINKLLHQVGISRQFHIWCTDTHTHTSNILLNLCFILDWRLNYVSVLPFTFLQSRMISSLLMSLVCSQTVVYLLPFNVVSIQRKSFFFLMKILMYVEPLLLVSVWPHRPTLCLVWGYWWIHVDRDLSQWFFPMMVMWMASPCPIYESVLFLLNVHECRTKYPEISIIFILWS